MTTHKLKSNSMGDIVIGNIIISPNTPYQFYDSERNLFGDYIIDFIDSFSNPEGINKLIHTEQLSYLKDDKLATMQDFFDDWYPIKKRIPENYTNGKNFKIYSLLSDDTITRYSNPTNVPFSIDFKKDLYLELQQSTSYNKGLPVKIEYFSNMDMKNPIVKSEYSYVVGMTGYLESKTETISWTTTDGTYDHRKKVLTRNIESKEALTLGNSRRENIIRSVIENVIGLIMMTEPNMTSVPLTESVAMPLFDACSVELNKYFNGSTAPLVNKIAVIDVTTINGVDGIGNWMDNYVPALQITIRQYIINVLTSGDFVAGETVK